MDGDDKSKQLGSDKNMHVFLVHAPSTPLITLQELQPSNHSEQPAGTVDSDSCKHPGSDNVSQNLFVQAPSLPWTTVHVLQPSYHFVQLRGMTSSGLACTFPTLCPRKSADA
mmetsp:Transcript_123287/g.359967  ORF Transcript_123287/g.359967 Transcript_123287/m.359967 type:complete len:112 (+) Transcript_123287:958-1293(+)